MAEQNIENNFKKNGLQFNHTTITINKMAHNREWIINKGLDTRSCSNGGQREKHNEAVITRG